MRKMMISKTNRMKSIIAFTLLIMFLFVGGCTDSPTKPVIPEPGVISMVLTANEMRLRVYGKGEMFLYIEQDGYITPYKSLLTELELMYPAPLIFHYLSNNMESHITIKGHITHFQCRNNGLTALDVSGMPSLISLDTLFNPLFSLDVSNNKLLEELYLSFNFLSSLDISKNTALKHLWCDSNYFTSLDISYNKLLTDLHSYGNRLTSLDVTQNKLLAYLSCGGNQLKDLDLNNNTELISLTAHENQFEHLDLQFNTKLELLNVYGNNINRLDLSNNPSISQVTITDNQLNAETLNGLFQSLPDVNNLFIYNTYYIFTKGNPGDDECNKSIAEDKGWTFWTDDMRLSEHGIETVKEKK